MTIRKIISMFLILSVLTLMACGREEPVEAEPIEEEQYKTDIFEKEPVKEGTVKEETENGATTEGDTFDAEPIEKSTEDELFRLTLSLDRDRYSEKESIECYATLEYIGEEDSITVYSSDPMVVFTLKDGKYFNGDYAVNDVLVTSIFKKGEPVRFEFVKTGGWSGDDPNAAFYEEFYSEKALILPVGSYEISTIVMCSLDQNDVMGSKYSQSVTAKIEVVK